MDDMLAFYRHYFTQSGVLWRQELWANVIVGIGFLVTSLLIESDLDVVTQIAWAAIAWVLFGTLFHFLFRSTFDRRIRGMLEKGRTEGLLGDHELEFDESFLTERTSVNETRYVWSAIDRIDETSDHAFIFISTYQAHVIPRQRVVAGDLDRFLDRAREILADARPSGS